MIFVHCIAYYIRLTVGNGLFHLTSFFMVENIREPLRMLVGGNTLVDINSLAGTQTQPKQQTVYVHLDM